MAAAGKHAAEMADALDDTGAWRKEVAHARPIQPHHACGKEGKQGNPDEAAHDILPAEVCKTAFDPILHQHPKVGQRVADQGDLQRFPLFDAVFPAIPEIEQNDPCKAEYMEPIIEYVCQARLPDEQDLRFKHDDRSSENIMSFLS